MTSKYDEWAKWWLWHGKRYDSRLRGLWVKGLLYVWQLNGMLKGMCEVIESSVWLEWRGYNVWYMSYKRWESNMKQ